MRAATAGPGGLGRGGRDCEGRQRREAARALPVVAPGAAPALCPPLLRTSRSRHAGQRVREALQGGSPPHRVLAERDGFDLLPTRMPKSSALRAVGASVYGGTSPVRLMEGAPDRFTGSPADPAQPEPYKAQKLVLSN